MDIAEHVVLVNERDEELGIAEKMQAHQTGELHRAFSILAFNDKGETLIQQRAAGKYHSALLWSNSCCSHPRKDESIVLAAKRRLWEELRAEGNIFEPSFSFIYRTQLDNNLIEHELDHVCIALLTQMNAPNPEEVQSLRFVNLSDLRMEMKERPETFTFWFKEIIFNHFDKLQQEVEEKIVKA